MKNGNLPLIKMISKDTEDTEFIQEDLYKKICIYIYIVLCI